MNCQISFGRIERDGYNKEYQNSSNMNGATPDKKVLDTIKKHLPNGGLIADIGAGDGRNTIPLGDSGYAVDAFETSSVARAIIEEKAQDMSSVEITNKDILDDSLPKNLYDGAFMSHVTQHFNTEDMGNAFQNIYQGLKNGGIFLFDALVDKLPGYKKNTERDEESGSCHFAPGFIENLSQKNGFQVHEIADFAEEASSKGDYYGAAWGVQSKKFPELKPRPVELKWFTLKKP